MEFGPATVNAIAQTRRQHDVCVQTKLLPARRCGTWFHVDPRLKLVGLVATCLPFLQSASCLNMFPLSTLDFSSSKNVGAFLFSGPCSLLAIEKTAQCRDPAHGNQRKCQGATVVTRMAGCGDVTLRSLRYTRRCGPGPGSQGRHALSPTSCREWERKGTADSPYGFAGTIQGRIRALVERRPQCKG